MKSPLLIRAARVTTALLGLGILVIGVLYLIAPAGIAASFGTDLGGTRAALAVKGVRDIATGVVALAAVATVSNRILGWALLAFALIPVGDASIVLASGGSALSAFAIHGLTAAVMCITALALLRPNLRRRQVENRR